MEVGKGGKSRLSADLRTMRNFNLLSESFDEGKEDSKGETSLPDVEVQGLEDIKDDLNSLIHQLSGLTFRIHSLSQNSGSQSAYDIIPFEETLVSESPLLNQLMSEDLKNGEIKENEGLKQTFEEFSKEVMGDEASLHDPDSDEIYYEHEYGSEGPLINKDDD